MNLPELEKRKRFSLEKMTHFRASLARTNLPENCSVVINGSFARGDASELSDVDYFIICKGEADRTSLSSRATDAVKKAIVESGLREPADGGAFGQIESMEDFLQNVGGTRDPNEKLTRRMLLLLEGDWLFGQRLFDETRIKLIQDVYIKDLQDHQIARFFLNDLIRYWRTIGVDFAFKTGEVGKPWGTRILKLLFSRKIIYFSGLLMAAETVQKTKEQKINRLLELAGKSPVERVENVCGSESAKALGQYEHFLNKLGDKSFRDKADCTTEDRAGHSEEFRELKNLGQLFSWELDRLLISTYGHRHPIHHALIF